MSVVFKYFEDSTQHFMGMPLQFTRATEAPDSSCVCSHLLQKAPAYTETLSHTKPCVATGQVWFRYPRLKTSALICSEKGVVLEHISPTKMPFYWEQLYRASLCLDAHSNRDLTIHM